MFLVLVHGRLHIESSSIFCGSILECLGHAPQSVLERLSICTCTKVHGLLEERLHLITRLRQEVTGFEERLPAKQVFLHGSFQSSKNARDATPDDLLGTLEKQIRDSRHIAHAFTNALVQAIHALTECAQGPCDDTEGRSICTKDFGNHIAQPFLAGFSGIAAGSMNDAQEVTPQFGLGRGGSMERLGGTGHMGMTGKIWILDTWIGWHFPKSIPVKREVSAIKFYNFTSQKGLQGY